MQSRYGLRNEEVSPGEGGREGSNFLPEVTYCIRAWWPEPIIRPKVSQSSFVVSTKLFCFSKIFFWEKQSEDIFLLFRIPNLLGLIRIYSSLLLFIVVHMFMVFWKINGDRIKNKDNCSGHGLMSSSRGENKFPPEMREWFCFIILCPFMKASILPTL